MICIHVMEMLIPAPTPFPDLYPTLNVLVSFGVFGLAWLTALWTLLQTAVGYVGFGRWTLGQGLGQAPKRITRIHRKNKWMELERFLVSR